MKNYSRLIALCFVALLIVVTGCSPDPPAERFHSCFKALLDNDLEQVHKYFVFIDRSTIAGKEFTDSYTFSPAEVRAMDSLGDYIEYNMLNSHQDGDTVRARISIQVPVFMDKIIHLLFFSIDTVMEFTGQPEADVISGKLLLYQGMIVMVKEGNAWFMYGNWEEQRQRETQQSQERLEYMNQYLMTSDVRVHYTRDSQVRLSVTLHNKGVRTLTSVEIYIIGYTKDNRPCFTATDDPLEIKPLLPNSKRRFSIDISQAPANWSGRVDVRVLNCNFGQ